ncbi:hypothetical protein JCM9534A_15490 [Catenuloplanes indicus JCM 9534]
MTPGVFVATAHGYAAIVDTAPAHSVDHPDVAGLPAWRALERLAGRALLRRLLAVVEPAVAGVALVAAANGKPALAGHPGIGVNISHDDGTVAACVGLGRAVGVDVQSPPAEAGDGLVRRCAPTHAARLRALEPAARASALAWIWTVQEACVKATGAGLAGRPWAVEVPLDAHGGRWRHLRWHRLPDLSDTPLSCAWTEER